MILNQDLPYERFYEPEHMAEVLADMLDKFDHYFETFAPSASKLAAYLNNYIAEFQDEQARYQSVLDIDFLYDCDEDPGTFKNIFKAKYPIIRRCLNSRSKLMDGYRRHFYETASQDMLETVINIVEFAREYQQEMEPDLQTLAQTPQELGISELDEESYGWTGIIGGGIRSTFLYHVDPSLFPSRGGGAIWAYYFLTSCKNYNFKDYSEFLMVDVTGEKGTQQNYFYPYDLFTWYGLQLFLKLREKCQQLDYPLTTSYRYVYLDAFLGYISQHHEADISAMGPHNENTPY